MDSIVYLLIYITVINAETQSEVNITQHIKAFNGTRRILRGNEAGSTMPYMVYLRPAKESDSTLSDPNWLCGGSIIDKQHVLTSAACIENVKHFYVVSGTHRWTPPSQTDDCITYGAKRAVWKCVPSSYEFDGHQFDNIRWMMHDIAVVKVEDEFNFQRRVLGCDFIPKPISYNNQSQDFEKPGTEGSIAGWGSQDRFGEVIKTFDRQTINSPALLETSVTLISKRSCKRHWPERYHRIIDQSMICGKDGVNTDAMTALCNVRTAIVGDQVKCKELIHSEEDGLGERRSIVPNNFEVHGALHYFNGRRNTQSGGFCENDHGGPLVVGHGSGALVVGVMSACLTTDITRKCYGPFLYTSVWEHRHLIACAIDKENAHLCRKMLLSSNTRLSETIYTWKGQSDRTGKTENFGKYTARNPNLTKSRHLIFRAKVNPVTKLN